MDDTANLTPDVSYVHYKLERLEGLIRWCRTSFKLKRPRKLSSVKSKVVETMFAVVGQAYPTVMN